MSIGNNGKWDWKEIQEAINNHGPYDSMSAAADSLQIPRTTLKSAVKRYEVSIVISRSKRSKLATDEFGLVSKNVNGNSAIVKYNAAEPLTPLEVTEIANLDLDKWKMVSHRINMWQVGKNGRKVSLSFDDGKMSGTINDDGEFNKTYLYQIEIKLERINRIAILPVINPISINIVGSDGYANTAERKCVTDKPANKSTVLFICDPHFGFKNVDGKLHPIHHRPFISSLLNLSFTCSPDVVIWNGDVLDLADWSSFVTDPSLMNYTQLAGIELAWVLGKFNETTPRQIIIEGNHDFRLERALVKNFQAAFDLRPALHLNEEPLVSVPRFLGLKEMSIEWAGGYPDNYVQYGNARFIHGNIARKGSGKTAVAVANDRLISTFFGHIHRHELLSKFINGSDKNIFVGSPGCACDKRYVPGAKSFSNWQLGAFLVHFEMGDVVGVEHITGQQDGYAKFRGASISNMSYMDEFLHSIPSQYADQF